MHKAESALDCRNAISCKKPSALDKLNSEDYRMIEIEIPLEPVPISPRKPLSPFCLSQVVASVIRSTPIVEDTQVGDVPEPVPKHKNELNSIEIDDLHTIRI